MCGLLDQARQKYSYDAATGLLSRKDGRKCGFVQNDRYYALNFRGKKQLMHRFIWWFNYGVWPQNDIDHINGNGFDNRLENLRDVTDVVNLHNVVNPNRDNKTSQMRGVHRHAQSGNWRSQITFNKKVHHVGLFSTPEKAREAYLKKKKELLADA